MHGPASMNIGGADPQIMSRKLPVTHHPLNPIAAAVERQIVSMFRLASILWQVSAVHNVQESWHQASERPQCQCQLPLWSAAMTRGHDYNSNCAFMLL